MSRLRTDSRRGGGASLRRRWMAASLNALVDEEVQVIVDAVVEGGHLPSLCLCAPESNIAGATARLDSGHHLPLLPYVRSIL